ncbi:heterokaryon incompatibility protein-domain-containing protein [Leptodontidium sp. 2 PMI_412]|nr:heterokaryon incompatibility protein-domain-containing protein [Leptodontidium sp. 2 PMI_412]
MPIVCPYESVPLNNTAGEVRLMTLLPGTFDQKIEAKLSTTLLIPGHIPKYEALSYCWGPSTDPQTIAVNGRSLNVTQSLATALPYLRLQDKARVLWIDAICVNQSDLLERSLQVPRMADVYGYAHRVIVWLGPESQSSTIAFETLRAISSRITVAWEPISITPRDHSFGEVSSLPIWGKDVLDAIEELLSVAWFERLWIWQEIRLANESSIIAWGNNQMLWSSFRDAILLLEWKKVHRLYPDNLSIATRLQTIVSIANKFDFMSFNTLLSVSRNSDCSDPRDRIYAILSLAKNYTNGYEPKFDLKPDYTKGAGDVYKEVTHQGTSFWTNWTQNDGTLEVWGLRCGIINETGKELKSLDSVQELQKFLRDLIPRGADDLSYPAGNGSLLDAYLYTLFWDDFAHHFDPCLPHQLEFCTLKREIKSFLSSDDSHATELLAPQLLNIIQKLRRNIECRRMVITEDGYIGVAPKRCKRGDLTYILFGCNSLIALRPALTGTGFVVVGECYIHGKSEGEPFLGPYPEDIMRISRYDPISKSWKDAFVKKGEENYIVDDPRLGHLPSEWNLQSHEYPQEVGVGAGVGYSKLSVDALLRTGLDVEKLKLV